MPPQSSGRTPSVLSSVVERSCVFVLADDATFGLSSPLHVFEPMFLHSAHELARRKGRLARPHGDRCGRATDLRPWPNSVGLGSNCTGTDDLDRSESHSCHHALQKYNLPEPFYTLARSLHLVELDPAYPKEPQTMGQSIRKARMDKHLLIRELAVLIGVSSDTMINWELRNEKPAEKSLESVRDVLGFV